MFRHKLKASGVHLLLSFLVLSLFFSLLLYIWFPEPYFTATGGWQGLQIVAYIDLVLGPLLTFIVFNPQKNSLELKRDLGFIILLQLSVLFGGMHTVYTQRPLAIVFWNNSFKTVSAAEIHQQYVNTEIFNTIKQNPLQFFVVKNPTSLQEKQKMLDQMSEKSIAPHQQLNFYKTINKGLLPLSLHSININNIADKNEDIKKQLAIIIKDLNKKDSDFIYIPLLSKYQNIFLVFNLDQEYIHYIKAPYNDK